MKDHEPTIRARELGMAVMRAAHAKGMHRSELARRMGWSPSKVSRMISGKRSVSPPDVSGVLAICGITGPKRDELLDIANHVNEPGWWQEYGDRLPPELCTLSNYEDAAIVIINFENMLVPGLLQTPNYMHRLMLQIPAIPPNEIPERLEARRRRQQILDRRYPAKFAFFIGEYALTQTGPGREVMSDQVHHLLRMAVRPHVEIRIVPDAVGFHAGQAPFQIMEFTEFHPIVHIECQTSVLFLERPDTIAGYRQVVAHLATVALDERQSREWLATLATELGEPREEHDEHAPPLEEKHPHQH